MLDGVVMGWCFRGRRWKGDGGNPSDWSGDYACFEGVVWEVGGGFSGLVKHWDWGWVDVMGVDVVVCRLELMRVVVVSPESGGPPLYPVCSDAYGRVDAPNFVPPRPLTSVKHASFSGRTSDITWGRLQLATGTGWSPILESNLRAKSRRARHTPILNLTPRPWFDTIAENKN